MAQVWNKIYCNLDCYQKSGVIQKKCPQCGVIFTTKLDKIYCSRKCHSRSQEKEKIGIVCHVCGRIFMVCPSSKKAGSKTCSDCCHRSIHKQCLNCGRMFRVNANDKEKSKTKYCTAKCSAVADGTRLSYLRTIYSLDDSEFNKKFMKAKLLQSKIRRSLNV
jgi:hypothetical protein